MPSLKSTIISKAYGMPFFLTYKILGRRHNNWPLYTMKDFIYWSHFDIGLQQQMIDIT